MPAERPEIAWPGHRHRRKGRSRVGIGEALGPGDADARQLVGVEPGQQQIDPGIGEVPELQGKQLVVPLRLFVRPVVGQPIRLQLRRRQTVGDVHRHLGHPEQPSRSKPNVADHHNHVGRHNDRLPPAELA